MHVCREMISPIYSVISVPFFTSTRVRKPQPRPRVYAYTLFSWEYFFFFPTLGALTGNTSNSLTNSLRLNRWLLHCSPHGHASGSHSYKSILDSTFLSVTLYVCDRTKNSGTHLFRQLSVHPGEPSAGGRHWHTWALLLFGLRSTNKSLWERERSYLADETGFIQQ